MLVKKYRSEIVSIQEPLKGIITLEFRSLDGKFKYYPGQFLHLAIDTEYDGAGQWPESRCFSMQSSPNESTIKITYAVKGRFTLKMEEMLQVGLVVWLKLPFGNLFSQTHIKENTVFIAGGTGITPFLSLFTHESFKDYVNPKIYLGFRSKSFNIYKSYLRGLNPERLNVYYEDVQGMLNINSIFKENGKGSDYFISGPPKMIKNFRDFLIAEGVSLVHVLTDEWE